MDSIQLILSPQEAVNKQYIQKAVANLLHLPFADILDVRILRRSVDARQKNIKVLLTVEPITKQDKGDYTLYPLPRFQNVSNAERAVIIVGAGPAGLFAALTLIENGIKPIIIERGKEVSERKRDIALLNRNEGLNTESNYCFGEGGAGTFSDGKLFSRSKKRGNMQRVMQLFHYFGANESILYETHAHIGSDKLPAIIKKIRQTIIDYGGEIHFNTCLTDLVFSSDKKDYIKGVVAGSREFIGNAVILAIGHSAHDTYKMLAAAGVKFEEKGFAMGVRVEHPQQLINRLMYHLKNDDNKTVELLGNASYSLVTQVEGRGVYSFCMCPGGHIVPAGSSKDSCVVNGMSASHRNSPYANSGIVVEIQPQDIKDFCEQTNLLKWADDDLNGLRFQEYVEHLAYLQGSNDNKAPAQRLRDFVESKTSDSLPHCSYLPGLKPSRLDKWLPKFIGSRLQQGFRDFDRKYKGFLTNDALVVGVESRSSSAVRIPRDKDTMQHTSISNLYPTGEGAGYAGGITSSALDGINAALLIVQRNDLP